MATSTRLHASNTKHAAAAAAAATAAIATATATIVLATPEGGRSTGGVAANNDVVDVAANRLPGPADFGPLPAGLPQPLYR